MALPPHHVFPTAVPISEPVLLELGLIDRAAWDEVARNATCVYSDVDDTLTDEGKLSIAAYAALRNLRAAGLRLVLVTGRPLGWAEVLTSLFPIDAAIAENGAVAALPGGRRVYFDDDTNGVGARRRAEAARRVRAELPEVRAASDQPLRDVDLAFDIAETMRQPEPVVARLRAILESEGLSVTRSSIHMHGTYSTGDKAKMAARIASMLWGDAPERVAERDLFVGDSPNDAPAFRFFAHAVGVANVRAHETALRALGCIPWAVTKARGGSGFAELADAILRSREGGMFVTSA